MTTNDFLKFRGRLEVDGTLELLTPLRVAGGTRDDLTMADIIVVKDAVGRPYIPGSSFKGVMRAYLESLLRTIDERLACLCVSEQPDHTCPTTMSKGRLEARRNELAGAGRSYAGLNAAERQAVDDTLYLNDTCAVCRVFGSPGLAAKVHVPDMPPAAEWFGRYQVRQNVAIDRDTETAADGKLFSMEVVPAGTAFRCRVIVENGSAADQGLVLLGLRAFERELATLGGGVSRGLGRVRLTIDDCRVIDDSPEALLDYLISGTASELDAAARNARISAWRAAVQEEVGA